LPHLDNKPDNTSRFCSIVKRSCEDNERQDVFFRTVGMVYIAPPPFCILKGDGSRGRMLDVVIGLKRVAYIMVVIQCRN
jgi:hypothetical protein